MLGRLDETLQHQLPVPFAQTTISDHRFFDRVWFGGHGRDGVHFLMGMGAYKNTNTLDGFFSLIKDGRQYNLRVSRPLLSAPSEMAAGPLSIEIIRPMEAVRLVVRAGDDHPLAADLTFVGTLPVSLEDPHFARADGRVTQDYTRYEQLGLIDGWIALNGERIAVSGWFGGRDHSWGVRPGMGGYDAPTSLPRAGENVRDVGAGHHGFLVVVLWFDLPSIGGYLMMMENGAGASLYAHGRVMERTGSGFVEHDAVAITHDLTFVPGTRTCSSGRIAVTLRDGRLLELDVETMLPPFCYRGTGYDGGYRDGRGLGVHRGDLIESDVYDVSHAEDVILPDGAIIRPWHREAGAIVRMAGEEGLAHFPVLSSGPIARYGLGV